MATSRESAKARTVEDTASPERHKQPAAVNEGN